MSAVEQAESMLQTPPSFGSEKQGVWVSWNHNIKHPYQTLHQAKSESELARWVGEAKQVRVFGHRYSSADICAGQPTLIDMTTYKRLLSFDDERNEVTVESGITLATLLQALEERGWSLPCLPDIDGVTLGGALATGTHGTGKSGQLLAQSMVRCRLVTADGQVQVIEEDDPRMPALRVSLGALGVMSQITLRCVPITTLHLQEGPMRDEDWLGQLSSLHERYDFLRILWLPHTGYGYVIRGNPIDPDTPVKTKAGPSWLKHRRKVSVWLYKYAYAFPRITAWANQLLYRLFFRAKKQHKGTLYGATVTKKRSATMELAEWTIARSRFVPLFEELKAALNDTSNDAYAHLPMDLRFLERDDTWLSYAYGEDCVTVGCVCRDSLHADRYEAFALIEEIFLKHGGRPHWAKRFQARHEALREVYPKWEQFLALRAEMDPEKKFLNPYLRELFGS